MWSGISLSETMWAELEIEEEETGLSTPVAAHPSLTTDYVRRSRDQQLWVHHNLQLAAIICEPCKHFGLCAPTSTSPRRI